MATETALRVRVRAASMADGNALAQFLSHAASDENIERYDVLGFLQEFKLPVAQVEAGQLFVAKQGSSIVGLASVVFRHDSDIEIDALLIDPSSNRVKVGHALVDAAWEFGRNANAAGVYVLAAESAKPDLEAMGFTVLGVDPSIEATVALQLRRDV